MFKVFPYFALGIFQLGIVNNVAFGLQPQDTVLDLLFFEAITVFFKVHAKVPISIWAYP